MVPKMFLKEIGVFQSDGFMIRYFVKLHDFDLPKKQTKFSGVR